MTQTLTLRDISDELVALDDLVAMDEGEWTPEHEALMQDLTATAMRKTDSFATYLQDRKTRVAALDDEIARLAARRKAFVAEIARLEQYALAALLAAGRPKLTGTLHTMAVQDNPASVVIDDAAALESYGYGSLYRIVPETRVPDKKTIGALLKAGEAVPGCSLQVSQRLVVK